MAPLLRSRRPLVSLEVQLQQLTMFSDLDVDSENLEQMLGPMIKDLDQAGQQDAFLRTLRTFVSEKEREIQAVCDTHHQDFVTAVDRLLHVRHGTVSLKDRIGELNEDVQAGGQSLGSKKRQLLETRRVAHNIDDAIETLQACLRVLDIANRIDTLIESKKYFSALRSLDELENVHLKPVLMHEFARLMLEGIPQTRERIRTAVTREMKEWLFEAREKSRTVGKLALDAMEVRQKRWKVKAQKDPMLSLAKVNSAIELVVNERIEYNFVDNEQIKIDFKPLYQCIHIYDVLNIREQLQQSYQEDRRAQANLLLSQGLNFSPSNPTFPTLLQEVVGFFLVEYHVLQTSPPGFRMDSEVNDLWDTMCERVVQIVSMGLSGCKDTKVFLTTKAAVQTFIQTLEGYNFTVEKLNALLLTLFERYAQLLRDRFAQDFQQAMKDTEHQPMVVQSSDELQKVLNVSWLEPRTAEMLRRKPFPLTLPFSQTYPLCCMDIRNLVDQYYTFSEGFSQHTRDIDDILKKTLDELLIQQVSTGIRSSLQKTNQLSQIVQIVVNAEHFKLACDELENLLIALRGGGGSSSGPAPGPGGTASGVLGRATGGSKLRLDSSSHFAHTLALAHTRIDGAIQEKLLQFLEMAAAFEYMPTRTKAEAGANVQPTQLVELMRWLSDTVDSVMALLKESTKMEVYRRAFAYIANHMLNTLLAKNEPALNLKALQNVKSDVDFLSEKARAGGRAEAASAFDEIQQTLSVLISDSVVEYATSPSIRNAKYQAIKPATLAALMEKLAKFHANRQEHDYTARYRRQKDAVMRVRR
ncbi:Rab GTPase-binding exocyst subunit S15 [Tilletia horrida]|uniref:Exocyst complex component SEC15 n=1 Tax=Tilletia horrida TaxID=155126 RepID=A0AAN6JTN1_9BASI|nr:Rab GTPase-binding exocyst subunit S15 [Tilletia horrida]KAK0565445.1 Rab GTPase-binding exocyst subunit S15 [Tilletia horrida]